MPSIRDYQEIHLMKKCSTILKVITRMHRIKVVIKLSWNRRYHQHDSIETTKIEKERSSVLILPTIIVFQQM